MISKEVREYLEGVEGVVEATNFEKHCLWQHYSIESNRAGFGIKTPTRLVSWQSATSGFIPCVGEFGGQPVHISIFVDVVNGHRLLFWHASGTTTNYDVIEKWLETNVPAYVNRTNAMNFMNIFSCLHTEEAA